MIAKRFECCLCFKPTPSTCFFHYHICDDEEATSTDKNVMPSSACILMILETMCPQSFMPILKMNVESK